MNINKLHDRLITLALQVPTIEGTGALKALRPYIVGTWRVRAMPSRLIELGFLGAVPQGAGLQTLDAVAQVEVRYVLGSDSCFFFLSP